MQKVRIDQLNATTWWSNWANFKETPAARNLTVLLLTMSHLFFRARAVLQHAVKAKDRHAVHSPFMAEFIQQVFRSKELPEDISKIEALRQKLLNDPSTVEMEDHGAGSHRSKHRRRKVRDIAQFAAKTQRDAAILFRAAKRMKAEHILELGTSLGISSLYLSSAPGVQLTTLEGCPNTLAKAQANFKALERKNITTVGGNFNDTLPQLLGKTEKIDLAFIDGDHRKAPTLHYFEQLWPKLHNNSLLVFDDIHWSPGMEEAWETIKADARCRVTVDIHRLGFVFFRKEMTPEHFDLRY